MPLKRKFSHGHLRKFAAINLKLFLNAVKRSIRWCHEDAFMLSTVFTPESVEMPVLEDTFCNPEAIPWEAYHGHIKDLLTDPVYRRGKFILLYPPTAEDSTGYRWQILATKMLFVIQRVMLFLPANHEGPRIISALSRKRCSKPTWSTYGSPYISSPTSSLGSARP